ncbi:alpha-D-ribose 1-methylphosphonate 5-triphosphate diphosphatase [Jiella sp. MQZ9-1]|uniref:Alpha-D-ribose 1-methylphosphonate 5-triphosphate diphosphatase n=1 Tax=Jiella flava TaxID=2816857 RepID=A0A939JSK6_9HYPH|nr:alpha-D-ribose 1-methylphosphonate 5-triphosphate diphosphatase [Jiella flava]MBO0661190.1 alpha-D-ribose 1-methylphosphonate 5-triphosphate diphosphatase [Jiella flava]MCD2469835.1 alpha-D-ribose 1-methylphosphonate 5-triphosphate diphosphatase [Jiella flava]
MTTRQILANARIVLSDTVIEGALAIEDGRIAAILPGPSNGGEDLGGDYLLPGLVELHTDQIEAHYHPRSGVTWHRMAAIQAHDGQAATAGMTTVLDAMRIGTDENTRSDADDVKALAAAIETGVVEGRFRAEHRLHLRCEVSSDDVVDGFRKLMDAPRLTLVSLMDHAPGQRQFHDLGKLKTYLQTKFAMSDTDFEAYANSRIAQSQRNAPPHRRTIADECVRRGITLASHDDATRAHVDESAALGIQIAEFPTTIDAARASREAGMAILMGAPNIVRGRSHSGNISALELLDAGLLDILSSDYVPFSLIQAVFALSDSGALPLPAATRLATAHPAAAVGLTDRGRIAAGLRADLVQIAHRSGEPPVVRRVWREGRRVA